MNFSSLAAASAWPLYFAATLLYDGPSFSAETEWHFRQPLALSALSPALASCACAPNGAAQTRRQRHNHDCPHRIPLLL